MSKAIFKKWWFWLIVVIIALAIIFGPSEEERQAEQAKQEQAKQEKEQEREEKKKQKEEEQRKKEEKEEAERLAEENASPEDKIEKAIKKKLGEETSVKGSMEEEPFTIQVEFLASDNLTKKMVVSGMKIDILDTIYIIKELGYEIDNLGISVKYPLVDQYGNEKDEYVIKSDFSGDTIKKLADDKHKVNRDNLNSIADSWWEHPALSD